MHATIHSYPAKITVRHPAFTGQRYLLEMSNDQAEVVVWLRDRDQVQELADKIIELLATEAEGEVES